MTRSILAATAALLLAAPARAQQPATSFEQLRGQIEPGETLSITDANRTTVKASLVELSGSSMDVRVERGTSSRHRRLSEYDVNNVTVERSDRWWNGPLIGLAAGAASGLLIELAGRTQYEKFSGVGAIGLGSVGCLTGLLIDVLNRDRVVVYVHPAGTRSLGAAMRMSFGF